MRKSFLISIGILITGLTYFLSQEKPANQVEQGENPGWYDYLTERKDLDNPDMPKNILSSWYKSDKVNRIATKKSIASLENINEIGPYNVAGRIRAVQIDLDDNDRYIVGGISGGIWVSSNAGSSWTSVNDTAATLSVTAITQSPFNTDVFYYSTGEPAGNSADLGGLGIFKSIDGASSFQQLPASLDITLGATWDIQHSKVFPNTFYVATSSQGLWRSNDGGTSFTRIFSSSTDIYEIECMEDSTIRFGRESVGVYSLNENTLQATALTNGMPGGWRRITFDISKNYPNVMYAHLSNNSQDDIAYSVKTSDGGQSWTQTTTPSNGRYSFAWYCFDITVGPNDTNFIMSNGVEPVYSSNGGASWFEAGNSHSDYHAAFWIDDNNVLIGNDGGLHRYNKNNMGNFTSLNTGLNITQFYAGYYPSENSNDVIGGTQDNGTRLSFNGSQNFAHFFGGDGSFCAISQQDDDFRYFSWQRFNMYRQDGNNGSVKISNTIKNVVGDNGVHFIHPFAMNNLDQYQLYVPTKTGRFYRSIDAGDSWTDITGVNGLLGDQWCVGVSNDENPTIYIGGNASRIYRIDNAATANEGAQVDLWNTSNSDFLGSLIYCIEVDPNDKGTIYIAMSNVSTRPRLWKAENADEGVPTYIDISGNLPEGLPVNWVEVDPLNSDHLFIGTDYGLYSSLNGGTTWQKEYRIPNVPIDQIRLRDSDRKLFIYTHGRGIWSADLIENPVASIQRSPTKKPTLTIYPNPATDILNIEVTKFERAEIYSSTGRLVKVTNDKATPIDDLPKGVYYISVTANGTTSASKLLVE